MNSYRDETISALADGQLTGSDFESALEQAAKDPV
jgi:predicted RNA-binding protein associated with RNAse of E/G family